MMNVIKSLIDSVRHAPSTTNPLTGSCKVWIHIEIWDTFIANSNIKIGTGSRKLGRMRKMDRQGIVHGDCIVFHEGLESVIKLLKRDAVDYRLSMFPLFTDIRIGISKDDVELVCNMLEALFFPQQTTTTETLQ